jgi:hypothetical protein
LGTIIVPHDVRAHHDPYPRPADGGFPGVVAWAVGAACVAGVEVVPVAAACVVEVAYAVAAAAAHVVAASVDGVAHVVEVAYAVAAAVAHVVAAPVDGVAHVVEVAYAVAAAVANVVAACVVGADCAAVECVHPVRAVAVEYEIDCCGFVSPVYGSLNRCWFVHADDRRYH